jgi:peptide/nickel transport system substrate-binding protein
MFDRWDKDQRVILKRWEKYYGKKYNAMPKIKKMVFELIGHKNTQLQSLVAGDIDDMNMEPEQWLLQTDTPEFDPDTGSIKKIKYPARVYRYVGYNLKNPLFKDKRVRQALTHCVDRQKIIKDVYFGLARLITGSAFMDTPYYDKSIEPYPFSIDKAIQLLKEAGWVDTNDDGIIDKDGKEFEFSILIPSSSPAYPKILAIMKEDFAKAGIVINIRKVEWSVMLEHFEKKSFEAVLGGWQMGLEFDPYQLWHSSQADKDHSSNHVGFKNKRADELIEEIRKTFDVEKRIKLCHEFHKILHEEQPYTFLSSPYTLLGQNKRFNNIKVFPSFGVPNMIMWLPKDKQRMQP